MPEMIFKISCTGKSCLDAQEMLKAAGLRVEGKDSYSADYYATSKDISYMDADKLTKDLKANQIILDADFYPVL